MKRFFLLLLMLAGTANSGTAWANEQCPHGGDSFDCTSDPIPVTNTLNVEIVVEEHRGMHLQFWNKLPCTLKPFEYQVEYSGLIQNEEGGFVPGEIKKKYKFDINLPSHTWMIARGSLMAYMNSVPKITILTPLECEQEQK